MRWLRAVVCLWLVLTAAISAFPQIRNSHEEAASGPPETTEFPIVDELRFAGLRRIAPAAVAAQMSSRPGDRVDPAKIAKDVRALARLGWFASIRVEEAPSATAPLTESEGSSGVILTFHLEEQPFLSKVQYEGSRLLSSKQIEKLLEEKKLALGLGKPADPAALQVVALAIRSAIHELGHPDANVQVRREQARNATVAVRFEIDDGPSLRVRQVRFTGNPQLAPKLLRAQMRSIAPWKPLASWRGKDAYTREAFEQDRQRILEYCQDQGYPEARIGNAQVARFAERSRQWLPWPHEVTRSGLSLSIPVEAGNFYRFASIKTSRELQKVAEDRGGKPVIPPEKEEGRPFSRHEIDMLRRAWTARLQPKDVKGVSIPYRSVEARPSFDPNDHTVRVTLDLNDSPPYIVRRIEFQGLHKFNDRYVRRRIPLREGHPVDDRALEAGLARLARTGYFKPTHKEDIHVQLDEVNHIADVSIRLEEIGRQRASLVGGRAQFGSTLGIAYTVFNLLHGEELLSSQLEGGPESLQIMLGLAKEGIFGTRGSLAFSVFNNVVRPRFASSAQGPFFSARSEGINIPWNYAVTNADSLGVNYTLSRTTTEYPLAVPTGTIGATTAGVRTDIASRSLGTGWAHDTGNERVLLSDSVSGGWLGGSENVVRSSSEFGRIIRDPFFSSSNAWAFRTTLSGAGSYLGEIPLYARLFAGDEFVRGLRTGELGPYALTTRTLASGAQTYSASPTGANLITAANAEYRFHLSAGTEAVGFFDIGSGRLLPNWLGPAKPVLLNATNGALHGSTGIELRWNLPGVQVPLRAYYALNVLRLDRSIPLSDKSIFRARNRFSAFGWGLGALF